MSLNFHIYYYEQWRTSKTKLINVIFKILMLICKLTIGEIKKCFLFKFLQYFLSFLSILRNSSQFSLKFFLDFLIFLQYGYLNIFSTFCLKFSAKLLQLSKAFSQSSKCSRICLEVSNYFFLKFFESRKFCWHLEFSVTCFVFF